MILVKLGSFMYYNDHMMKLIRFAESKFWAVTYDEVGTRILEEYDKLGMTMTYTFILIVYFASFNYIFAPIFGTVLASAAARFSVAHVCTCEATRYRNELCFLPVYRASKDERDPEDTTVQTVVRFSISLAILRNHLHHTGNERGRTVSRLASRSIVHTYIAWLYKFQTTPTTVLAVAVYDTLWHLHFLL